MRRPRLATAAVAAALAGLAGSVGGLAVLAVPAGAAPNQSPPCSQPPPTGVSICKPAQNDVETTSTTPMEGKITTGDPKGQLTSLVIRFTSSGHSPTNVPLTPQQDSGQPQLWTFSGSVPSSTLAWNGPYTVVATATEDDAGQSHSDSSSTISFAEGVAPQPPTGVTAAKDADGSAVTVSWQANPEPDIVGYQVQRASVNGSDWSTVTPGNGGTDTNYRDTSIQPGTDYQYRVIAVRSGAQQGQTISSGPSTPASTVAPPAGALFGPGGSVPELPLAIQAITDPVAGQVHPGQGPGGPVTGSPTAGGYGNLPYNGGQASLAEPGTPGAQDPKGRSAGTNLIRTALFVAGALILLAIAAHLIRMRRSLDDRLEPVGVDNWDRHAAGGAETAQIATVGTDRRGPDATRTMAAQRAARPRSDQTRAIGAQPGRDDRSAITRAMTAQRRR